MLARCASLDQVIGFNIFEEGFYQLINYWAKNGIPLFIEELLINVNNRPLDNPDEPWKILRKLEEFDSVDIWNQIIEMNEKQGYVDYSELVF